MMDERLRRIETQVKATENKVGKNDNLMTDGNEMFDMSGICNSTVIAPELNNSNKDEVSNLIQKEIKKFDLESSRNKSVSTDVSQTLRNAIRAEFMSKDSNVRWEYKLTKQTKLEHFMDFLRSELSIADLLYVIDSDIKATVEYDDDVVKRHKCKIRDIIINRIDQTYHAKVVEIQDPKEILKTIREIKINETNVTSMTLRRQLYSMQYNPLKEKANVFIDRFEEVIRAYNNLSEVENLPETEKKDAFYKAVVNAVPQILNIAFMTKSMSGKQLTYDNLKLYIMQVGSIKVQATTVTTENKTAHLASMEHVRCYECDGFGHKAPNCPRLSSGKKKCFECKQYTDHIAANCPQRLQRQRGERTRYRSTQYKSGNRGDRGGRGNHSGYKRKSDGNDSHLDPKRHRPDKSNRDKATPRTHETKRMILDREVI